MELKESIAQALTLTRRLRDALDTRDLEQWLALLELRGRVMADFEAAHRASGEGERRQFRTELQELQNEDRELTLKAESILDLLAGEFRELRERKLPAGREVDRDRYRACLDRKA